MNLDRAAAHTTLRIERGLEGEERTLVLACWKELWRGAVQSHRTLKELSVNEVEQGLLWTLIDMPEAP